MRHVRGLQTNSEALQAVFKFSLGRPICPNHRTKFKFSPAAHNLRCASFQTPRSRSSRPPPRAPFEARETDVAIFGPRIDRPRRDEEIKVWRAHLRQSDGRLSEALPYGSILEMRQRDDRGSYLQFVREIASADENRAFPIVEILDWKTVKEKELAKKKATRGSKVPEKQLEMSWAIDPHDLGIRLGKMQDFLQKGAVVVVLIGSSRLKGWKKKREVSHEEGQALVQKIERAALDVSGTKQRGGTEGQLLASMQLTFQGPGKKTRENPVDDEAPDTQA